MGSNKITIQAQEQPFVRSWTFSHKMHCFRWEPDISLICGRGWGGKGTSPRHQLSGSTRMVPCHPFTPRSNPPLLLQQQGAHTLCCCCSNNHYQSRQTMPQQQQQETESLEQVRPSPHPSITNTKLLNLKILLSLYTISPKVLLEAWTYKNQLFRILFYQKGMFKIAKISSFPTVLSII